MLFCSQKFLLFFLGVFAVYWIVRHTRFRILLLLAASFYFYASWNKWLALVIAVSATIDYAVALGLDAIAIPWRRKCLLVVSLAGNLGLLAYFKYADFFLHSLEELLHAAGDTTSLPVLKVIVPIGISFYTFEAISYTVDVYRKRTPAERNLFHFLLFITFFPHLVAGPIVRARDFLPQIRRPKKWSWLRFELGFQFIVLGLFKKMAVADHLALYVDPVFASPMNYGSGAIWLAMLAYVLQIYCDFSGYSDMAVGAAHMLGYKLTKNFDMPYIAKNVAEFWQRWHISLSTWLRDYVYIPLGGSRGGRWFVCRNLMITMLLGGLWHGASWAFIFWGFLHGSMLVLHRLFREFCQSRPALDAALTSAPGTLLRWSVTFLFLTWSLAFVRALSFGDAWGVLHRLVIPHGGLSAPLPALSLWYTLAAFAIGHALVYTGAWKTFSARLSAPAQGLGYAAAFSLALMLAPGTTKTFIYFQF